MFHTLTLLSAFGRWPGLACVALMVGLAMLPNGLFGQTTVAHTVAGSMPDLGPLAADQVQITLYEHSPAYDRWPAEAEPLTSPALAWTSHHFLLTRLPLRYDVWGIRDSWQAPLLVRMSADVSLPPGNHRVLLRARALARLLVDGQVVATTEPITKSPPDGEEPITPIPTPILPGTRLPGYHQQEAFGTISIEPADAAGKKATDPNTAPSVPSTVAPSIVRRVVLELIVGGKGNRTETGEVCVAIQKEGADQFELLQPVEAAGKPVQLTDHAVVPLIKQMEATLNQMDDTRRRQAAASRDTYWATRRQYSSAWLDAHPAPSIPSSKSQHPIDAFLEDKVNQAVAASAKNQSAEATLFHEQVLPLLRSQCFRCHADKANGGLRLNHRDAALAGGDSGQPSIAPGDVMASELIRRIKSSDESERMPPGDKSLSDEQIQILSDWIERGANWYARPVDAKSVVFAPPASDAAFLRRLHFDTLGLPPTLQAVSQFLADTRSDKRQRLVDELLTDSRLADHWISYWQDTLAENPTLINASLNSTGPFRWFLHDALRDNKPVDRWVTELILMRGNPHEGGSAGFSLAGENDAPMATKAQVLGSAFLGIEMQCARCHDSPYHSTLQRDLYSLAAFLERKPVTVPKTSSVPVAFFEKKARASLIKVSLEPGKQIEPSWPFGDETGCSENETWSKLLENAEDPRERLATLITAPENQRFAQVFVNRIWKQLMGAGIVEPVHDWEGKTASHPELLRWLARDFVEHGYDFRHLLRTILTSEAYGRIAVGQNALAEADIRFFTAPDKRRLTAEQVVDNLYATAGIAMDIEELTFVHDGRRPSSSRLTLGKPSRAWMMASLNNERDRPSLTLPKAAMVAEVLEAFGWTGSRQNSINMRENIPTAIQPGVLNNSLLTLWLTRVSVGSPLAELGIEARSPEELANHLFLRYLGRPPVDSELAALVSELSPSFSTRVLSNSLASDFVPSSSLPLVTWFNHLQSEANSIQQEHERRVAQGPPTDSRIDADWRERLEDAVWSLVNHPEFVWVP
ncbi:MAG: DUF1553 domain-containing protein [Pirellulaceae bacterium]|nr:DUF1553 domain-containing protein [Pirellulaceae bacterium]